MGLRDHLEDGTGHILTLGLDLDYLHVEGADRQAGLSTVTVARNAVSLQVGAAATLSNSTNSIGSSSSSTSCSTRSSYSISSSCSNFSEESAISDSEDERLQNGSSSQNLHQDQASFCQPFKQELLAPNRSPRDPPQPEAPPPSDPVTDCRTKVDFALKLGYSEELVLLVLKKLGPDALINDILGELVKLGTKTEMEQQRGGGGGGGGGGSTVSRSPSSSLSSSLACSSTFSSSTSSLDSCRLMCPSQMPEDKENLRPVVVDGSNVAMRSGRKVFLAHFTPIYEKRAKLI